MHGYFLQLEAEKMSKSSGKFLRVQTLIDHGIDPLAYRYFCLSAHYRAKLTFSWEGLDGASKSLERLRNTVYEWGAAGKADDGYIEKFMEPGQRRSEYAARPGGHLGSGAQRAGCIHKESHDPRLRPDPRAAPGGMAARQESIPAEILALVQRAQDARREKRWADADALRKQVSEAGYEIEDTPKGPE